MTWNYATDIQTLKGKRVIEISDGKMTYFAVMEPRQRQASAVEEFVNSYDWNGLDAEKAEENGITIREAREELEQELRRDIYVRMHRRFGGHA